MTLEVDIINQGVSFIGSGLKSLLCRVSLVFKLMFLLLAVNRTKTNFDEFFQFYFSFFVLFDLLTCKQIQEVKTERIPAAS